MTPPANAYLRHQQSRWLRPDAARWVRPDAARFLAPNADVLAALPGLERKYNPNQPRVPAGSPQGGQWTDEDQEIQGDFASDSEAVDWTESLTSILQESETLRPRVIIDATNWDKDSDQEIRKEVDSLKLFSIGPGDRRISGIQLAGDPPGIGDNGGPPLDEPPKIPARRPDTTEGRMKFVRDAARWLARVGRYSPLADIFFGAADQIKEITWLTDTIRTANDPPQSLEDARDRAQTASEAGYHDHHMVNQHQQNRDQFGDSKIDSYENKVRIPTLQHIEISRWYQTGNEKYGGQSPANFLRGKSWDEQMKVGLEILREKGVLK